MHHIEKFLEAKSIALIGATDRPLSVGRALVENLIPFNGKTFFINPNKESLFGKPCYKSIKEIKEPIDLAIICIKAAYVLEAIKEIGTHGIKAAIIISAGFKEMGEEGLKLENALLDIARAYQIRIIGPNCLGMISPTIGLNATFSKTMAFSGNVAFISQSGAMCTSLLDFANDKKLGFSAFISVGSMSDLEFADFIDYFANDHKTDLILLYMESLGTASRLLMAAKKASFKKPIVALKPGRSEAAALAAASHTGSLVGSDTAVEALLDEAHILRALTMEEFFDLFLYYALEKGPENDKIAVITNAGGMGVLTADAIELGNATALPPIDLLGDALSIDYEKAYEKVKQEGEAGSIIAIASPQSMTPFDEIAQHFIEHKDSIPLVVSFVGEELVKEGVTALKKEGLIHIPTPDRAAHLLTKVIDYQKKIDRASSIPDKHGQKRSTLSPLPPLGARKLLTEYESKEFLQKNGLPVVETILANDEKGAVSAARSIGYPVCVKLNSTTITHKSDVGGVILNLRSDHEVEQAFNTIKKKVEAFEGVTVQKMANLKGGIELIFGLIVDPQVGPLVTFGSGGINVELYKDVAFGIPPLTKEQSLDLFEKTQIIKALKGYRNLGPINLDKLATLFMRFSEIVYNCDSLQELDLNPLIATKEDILILDARIVIR